MPGTSTFRSAGLTGARRGATRRPVARFGVVFTAALVALGSTLVSVSTPASAATLPPLKIGLIGPTNTSQYNIPDDVAAEYAAAAAANKAGGVAGRKVVIDYCNEEANPNVGEACARQMVSDGVVATVGTLGLAAEGGTIGAILQQAGIPQVDEAGVTSPEYASLNNYDNYPGIPLEYAGLVHMAAQRGLKKIFVFAGKNGVVSQIAATVAAGGLKVVGSALVTETEASYAPFIQQYASSGADAAIESIGLNGALALFNAAGSVGTHVQWLLNEDTLTASAFKSLGSEAEGMLIDDGLPPLSAVKQYPDIKTYESQVAAYHKATGDPAANIKTMGISALAVWTGVEAVLAIAKKDPGLTAAKMTSTLDTIKNLPVPLTGAWTPSDRSPAPYQAYSNFNMYLMKIHNGAPVLLQTKPYDVLPIMKKIAPV